MKRIVILIVVLVLLASCSQPGEKGSINYISFINMSADLVYWSVIESSSTDTPTYSRLGHNAFGYILTEANTEYTVRLYSYDETTTTISENKLTESKMMSLIDEFNLTTTTDYNAIYIKSGGIVEVVSN